ncbi:DUF4082 domain-containing protein [Actinoplanes sichuanensis]|uniref:DUF4082 domain-containing protein n=1 Tax=Actinoplanes sichuanensis TaxID=512349 RepID=A0ABW4AT87_9ACTN|nr:DUF4082 domain-containing protein [Actinoplanes sichuanensis]
MPQITRWIRRISQQPRRSLVGAFVAVTLVAASLVGGSTPAAAETCGDNPIVCENALDGSPSSEWEISGAGDHTIQGFAADISVNAGQRIDFKIKTEASAYSIKVYRLGWYDGDGARFITDVDPTSYDPQPENCITDEDLQLLDCGNWHVSAHWNVPTTQVSGIYVARLKRTDITTTEASHITFVVRNDNSHSDLYFKTSDATWQAYNLYGGADFYQAPVNGRALKISYNRPFATRGSDHGRDFLFSNEYPMLRFLERNGYDMSYTTDVDTDRHGELIKNHKTFLSVGHDEYWSGAQRAHVEAARDAGVNLAFFSGNEVYWRTRWETSKDGSGTPYRTLVCYKETWGKAKIDDTTPEWTGTWRDPRFATQEQGAGLPENALTGTLYMANYTDLALQVPAAQGKLRLWRNTGLEDMAANTTATLAPHTIGYESDEDIDNGFRPAGLIRLSTTTGPTPEYLQDFGNVTLAGTTTHHLTLYKAESGALVFGAGTVQWAWGLDQKHDGVDPQPADEKMQQATVNILADMGNQPATRMSNLDAAVASNDTQAPTVTITSPANNAKVTNGSQVTLQGTATDAGGGKVAGVEVSTDSGSTWHPADGTTSWSYSFYTSGAGLQAVRVRGIDDSANIQEPSTVVNLKLTGPTTIFGNKVPENPAADDDSAIEPGIRFKATDDGYITGIRFYKGAGNTGSHVGSLWSADGDRLATGTFANESSAGWQKLTFANPERISKNTVYVASYTAPNGHYAADGSAFSLAGVDSSPLNAPKSTLTQGNGVYAYNAGFPTHSYGDTNYYVDVMFVSSDKGAPSPVSLSPVAGATVVPLSAEPSVKFSRPLDHDSIEFGLKSAAGVAVPGGFSYDADDRRVTFSPSVPLEASTKYTATVLASDTGGTPSDEPTVWSFTTDSTSQIATLFADDATPQIAADSDNSAIELGVKFIPAKDGKVLGVRFWQGPGNGGTHTGTLWSPTGGVMARATFSGETGSGWQSVRFDSSVAVTAGTTYTVSYYAPNGHYSATPGFFSSLWTRGPLSTPATTANGVYRYGTNGYPTSSYGSTNYWVDALFVADTTGDPDPDPDPDPSPSPTPTTPPDGSTVGIFTADATPDHANWDDNDSITVGVKFTSDVAGKVTGMRFYKGPQNTGIHTGTLYNSAGAPVASAPFTSETASGWQSVTFSPAVDITPGETYTVAYWSSAGKYAVNLNQFASQGFDTPPLHVETRGGVYRPGDGFPATITNHNFWVDVRFKPNS